MSCINYNVICLQKIHVATAAMDCIQLQQVIWQLPWGKELTLVHNYNWQNKQEVWL